MSLETMILPIQFSSFHSKSRLDKIIIIIIPFRSTFSLFFLKNIKKDRMTQMRKKAIGLTLTTCFERIAMTHHRDDPIRMSWFVDEFEEIVAIVLAVMKKDGESRESRLTNVQDAIFFFIPSAL
jgi:hypothetical protein